MQLLKRKSKEAKARERYPEPLWSLLSLGEPDEETDYGRLAEPLADYVPDLIRMALDEDLNDREQDAPGVWAPLHAMHILGALGAGAAAEPLTTCLGWEYDWYGPALQDMYAGIGPAAAPILQAYLENPAHDVWGRIHTSSALTAIAQAHPEMRKPLIGYLSGYLDRPTADENADEESVTTFIICDLADLEASEAYPAIKRAFDEDRVDTQVTKLEDVEADLGMRPQPDYSQLEMPKAPGVRLALKCKVCGRERNYVFPKVYYDMGTADDEKKKAKYHPLIIPQRVVCSKCGAVDQYELAGMGYAALTADLLTRAASKFKGLRHDDQHVEYMEFEAMGRKMHPLEALERYQAEIARHPRDSNLYVGYGNVLRFLGRFEEARAEYQHAMELDPGNPFVYVDMGTLALRQGDRSEAATMWQRALQVTPNSQLPDQDKRYAMAAVRESLELVRAGEADERVFEALPDFSPIDYSASQYGTQPSLTGASKSRAMSSSPAKAQPPRAMAARRTEVGRNDPCPCGSGKKHKHCCMRNAKKRT